MELLILSNRYCLHIPQNLYQDMLAHARNDLPNECCGLLAGRQDDDRGLVTHHFPLKNVAPNPRVAYYSDPGSMLIAHRAMRQLEIEPLSIYHSHPLAPPIPSATDRRQNWWGETMVFIIMSMLGAEPDVRAWRMTPATATEVLIQVILGDGSDASADRETGS